MAVQQFNGTATTTPTSISFVGDVSTSVYVQNVDPGPGILQVSFDGGITYKSLANQWDFISIDANLTGFDIKTSTGSKLYEAIVAV